MLKKHSAQKLPESFFSLCSNAIHLINNSTICYCLMSILEILLLFPFKFNFIVEYLNGSKVKVY